MPAALAGALHALVAVDESRDAQQCYADAVRSCIHAGGCCASRASFVGACIGARMGVGAVPESWIARTLRGTEISKLAEELVVLRGSGAGPGAKRAAAATPPAPPSAKVCQDGGWRPSRWAGL